MRPRRALAGLAADVVAVLVFCAVGRRSHAEGLSVTGLAATAWPFLTGTGIGWVLARGWRRPTALAPRGDRVAVHHRGRHGVTQGQFGGCGREFRRGRVRGHRGAAAGLESRRCADGTAPRGRLRRPNVVGVFADPGISDVRLRALEVSVPSQISRSRPQPTGQRGATAIVMLAQVWAATCRATTRAVPLLQQRCAFRTERSGATRPEHLGLSG